MATAPRLKSSRGILGDITGALNDALAAADKENPTAADLKAVRGVKRAYEAVALLEGDLGKEEETDLAAAEVVERRVKRKVRDEPGSTLEDVLDALRDLKNTVEEGDKALSKKIEDNQKALVDKVDQQGEELRLLSTAVDQRNMLRARNTRELVKLYPIPALHGKCTIYPSGYDGDEVECWDEGEFLAMPIEYIADLLTHHGLTVPTTDSDARLKLKALYQGV